MVSNEGAQLAVGGQEDGWRRDPFGRHEARYFVAGRPTERVRDWDFESADRPPLLVEKVDEPTGEIARSVLEHDVVPPNPVSAIGISWERPPPPSLDPAPPSVVPQATPRDRKTGADTWVIGESQAPLGDPGTQEVSEPLAPPAGSSRKPLPGSTISTRIRVAGAAVVVLAALAIVLSAFHSGGTTPSDSLTPNSTTTTKASAGDQSTTSSVATTTTTPALPSDPQSSADGAADVLISTWAAGNRSEALSVATAQAVATLFSATYQSGVVIDRGCSMHAPPVTCSFGPNGGADPSDPLYSLSVSQEPGGGWYVSTVEIEG